MADKELSTLTAASLPLDGTELHYVVQGGNSRQVSGSAIVGISHTQAWSTITATPTTISGYGITDAQAKNSNLTTISSLTPASGGFMVGDGSAWAVESGATVRASLGLTIGSDVQGYDADLTTLGGLAKTDGNVIIGNGTSWTVESGSTLRASIGVAIGSDVQAYNAKLSSLAGLTLASGDLVYATGANAIAALNVGLDGQVLRIEGGLPVWATVSGTGDMAAAIYDPDSVGKNAFDQDNMTEGTTNKNYTATEQDKLSGIEAGANVTNTTSVTAAGGVIGPSSATDSHVALFDGTTGKLVKDSGKALSDFGDMKAANNLSDLDDANTAVVTIGAEASLATKAAAEAFAPSVAPDYLRTAGYTAAGDGGGAIYKKVASEPSHAGKFQSADGTWFELAEPKISPQMLGAKADDPGDGTGTDDAAAIRASIAVAKALGGTAVGFGKYRIGSKIVFNWRCDFGECDFIATGDATTGVATEVSTGSADIPTDRFDGQTQGHKFVLPNVRNTAKVSGSGVWTGTGLRVVNAHNLDIYEGQVTGFETGYDYYAYQNASAYNRVYCGFSNNNKRGRIVHTSNHASAWINEYEWYSNRYYMAANEFPAGTQIPGSYHLYMFNEGGATYLGGIMNNHKFYGGSWEGNGPEYHIRCQAAYTTFHDIRLEGSDGQRIKFDHQKDPDGSYNVLAFGRGVDLYTGLVITEDAGVKGNKLYSALGTSRLNGAAVGGPLFVLAPGGSSDTAVLKGVSNTDSAFDPSAEASRYTWEIGSKAIGGKAAADAANSIYMNPDEGALYFGDGTAPATNYIAKGSELDTIESKAHFGPPSDVGYNLGSTTRRWKYTNSYYFHVGIDNILFTSSRGSPEGSVTAGIGSLYTDSTGGKLYVKETGTGNTGWVMK